jgi:adenylate kinase family enzyme
MIAAAGGGKGTQGERLPAKFSVQHVPSGEVLLKAPACSAADAHRLRMA